MAYTPLQLGSPTSSKEAISRSLVKVDTMLNELYNTNPTTIDWTNFSNTILPSDDSTYDLGSANKKWRSLYVSSNTIYIGTSALSITAQGNIQVNGNTFSPVVSYNDLSNKPTFATVATSGSYADLSNKPALFSGSYTDLTNKPTIPTSFSSLVNGAYTVSLDSAGQLTFPDNVSIISTLDPLTSGGINGILISGKDRAYIGITNDAFVYGWDFRAFGLADYSTTAKPAIKFPGNGWLQEDFTDIMNENVPLQLGSQGSITLTATLGGMSPTEHNWVFGRDGGLTFPDDTVQSTAWTGSVAYSSVTGTPTLATVATSGSYADLTNKPTIPSITGLATESYVTNAIGNLVSTAPTALNTLSELATALGNDSNFSGTITASLGNRLRVDINTQNLTSLQKSNATTNLGLATVATTGIYFDLVNKPTIPTNLDSLTDVVITSATTGQVLKYNGTTWVNDVDLSGGGGGSSLPSRTVTTAVTSTIANGASENITVTGFKGYIIYKLQTSAAAWVRAYTSIAERTADESRTITTDPTPGSGVVAEIITTGAQTVNMAPATIGFSNENTPDVNIPIRVTNRSGSSAAITVTMTLIQIEV